MKQYMKNIAHTLYSVTEGMAVTASHLFRRPVTIQYPNKLETPMGDLTSLRYRGILQVDIQFCIGCKMCQKTCPIDCIHITIDKDKETKKRFLTKFDIDISKCMFCGLCSENCKTSAIYHTKFFNGVTRDLNRLTIQFVKTPSDLYKPPKGKDRIKNKKDLSGTLVKQRLKG